MAQKKEYLKFRTLLKEAIGDMSQKDFAKKTGLSDAHLNRLLNNPLISQPSQETLQKILFASPLINGHDLFQSCDYNSPCLGNQMWRNLDQQQAADIVSKALFDGFTKLRHENGIWSSPSVLLDTYLKDYGWMFQSIKIAGVSDNKDSNHPGQVVLKGYASWIPKVGLNGYFVAKTFFVIYGYTLISKDFLFVDLAIDGLSLFRAGHTDNLEDSLFEEGLDIRSLNNLTTFTKKNIDIQDSQLSRISQFLASDFEKLSSLQFGQGVVFNRIPDNFVSYIIQNKHRLRDLPRYNEMIEEIESLDNPSLDTVMDIVQDYSDIFLDTKGAVSMIIDILNSKANELEHPFPIRFFHSEHDNLADVIAVLDDNWISYGKVDVERMDYIESEFRKLIREIFPDDVSDVCIHISYPIDIKEQGNYIEPINMDFWD